jgi:hypothetical protein
VAVCQINAEIAYSSTTHQDVLIRGSHSNRHSRLPHSYVSRSVLSSKYPLQVYLIPELAIQATQWWAEEHIPSSPWFWLAEATKSANTSTYMSVKKLVLVSVQPKLVKINSVALVAETAFTRNSTVRRLLRRG